MASFVAAAPGFSEASLLPVYGLAEATLGVSAPPLGSVPLVRHVDSAALTEHGRAVDVPFGARGSRDLVSIGNPLRGVSIEIRLASGEVAAQDQVGEICVKSDFVMSGYVDDPATTESVVRDGWIHTGDLCFVGEGGLFICGRCKDLIIV